MSLKVESLYLYPVKSLGVGISVDKLQFGETGLENDSQYLLVNESNRFITQRSHSLLSQFNIQFHSNGWLVTGPKGDVCHIPESVQCGPQIHTQVWRTPLICREVDRQVSDWFSMQLGEPVRLVSLDASENRVSVTESGSYPLAFADGYPLLVCNQQSLDALNSKMDITIGMERFRPNVVYSSVPESEYLQAGLKVQKGGELQFMKPCVRCNIPAIEPVSSIYQKDVHSSVKALLRREDAVVFGMNAVAKDLTELEIGDVLIEFCDD